MIVEFNKYKKYNKVNAAYDFIKSLINGTEWDNRVYAAGGYVRDELLGDIPNDLDLMVDKENGGIEFSEWITKKLNIYKKGSNPIMYPRFGTAKFNLIGIKFGEYDLSDVDIEAVMPRSEEYEDKSRKPEVKFSSIEKDSERRDLTVNSMFKNLTNDEIIDPTGLGKGDLKDGVVRTTLDPDIIFTEDPLRMMRAIKVSTKYNWKLPLFMIKSIMKNSKKITYISFERINNELSKMLMTNEPDKAIKLIQFTGLSKYIFPELDKLIGLQQNKYHDSDAMTHTLRVLKNTPPDLVTRMAALFHDIGKYKTMSNDEGVIHFYDHEEMSGHIASDILRRLKYPNVFIRDVVEIIVNHMRTKSSGNSGIMTRRSLRKLKLDLGENLDRLLDLIHADNVSHAKEYCMPDQIQNIRKKLKELEEFDGVPIVKPPLNGDDVMRILNIGKGRIVGEIMQKLKDSYLDNPNMTKEEAEELIKKFYKK